MCLSCKFSQPMVEITFSKIAKNIPCLSPNLHQPSRAQIFLSLCNTGHRKAQVSYCLLALKETQICLKLQRKIKLFSALTWSPSVELGFLTARKNGGKRCHFSPRGLGAPGPAAGDGGGSGREGKAVLRVGGMRQESAWSEETSTKGATNCLATEAWFGCDPLFNFRVK